jgi:hypothetical protein
MSFEIKGLKEVQDNLRKMSEKAEKLNGQSVPLTDVMTDSFIAKNTSFSNFDELVDASGFKAESQEDFDAIPDVEWDNFIAENTNFSNWQDMINSAGAIYARKQLDL